MQQVEDQQVNGVNGAGTRKPVEDLEPEYKNSKGLREGGNDEPMVTVGGLNVAVQTTYYVLIEEVEDESGQSAIAPMAVHKQQSDQELEPGHSKVASHDSLHALASCYPDTDVSLLDHASIVGTITNSQGHLAEATLDKFHHCSL